MQITETINTYLWFLCRLTLTTLSKHEVLHSAKTNGRSVLLHLLSFKCLSKTVKEITFRCFFNILLRCRYSLRNPLALHFVHFFELVHGQKTKQQQKERCVEPLKKNIHSVPDYSSTCHGNFREKHNRAVNQMSNVFSSINEKPSFRRQSFLFLFFFLSHKDHTKSFTISQKSKFNKTFHLKVSGNLKETVLFLYIIPPNNFSWKIVSTKQD